MCRFRINYFVATVLVLTLSTVADGNAQQASDPYEQQIRNAASMGIALSFLEHQQNRIHFDLVRKHKNLKLILGGQSVTQENVDSFADENEHKLQILTNEMKRRGFSIGTGEYIVQTYDGRDRFRPCAAPLDHFGPLTVIQDASTIEFRDSAGKLSGYGVIVESTIAVVPGARDQVSPRVVVGVLRDAKMFLSMYDRSPMAKNPSAEPATCAIGVGTRLDATQSK